jgi:hypothetical protein
MGASRRKRIENMGEITTMTNREIDFLIAEHIMGLQRIKNTDDWIVDGRTDICPHYSTDISWAFEVVFKLHFWKFKLLRYDTHCCAMFIKDKDTVYEAEAEMNDIGMAICKAALKAVGVDIDLENVSN